jgi:hypothetical protein
LIRALRTTLRTLHLLAFAALYGGHLYGVAAPDLESAWIATLLTGAALMGVDLVREPVFLVQLRGWATVVKIGLLVAVQAAPGAAVPLLTTAAVLGAVSSHMPGRYRYWSVLHGGVVGSPDKG